MKQAPISKMLIKIENKFTDVGMIMMQTGMVNQGISSVINQMEGTII